MFLPGRSSWLWRSRAAVGALLVGLSAPAASGVDKLPVRVSFRFGEATLEQRCDPQQAGDIQARISGLLEANFPVWRFPVKLDAQAPSLRFQLLLKDHQWFLQVEAFRSGEADVTELRMLIPTSTPDPSVTAGRFPKCSQVPGMVLSAFQENWLKPENAPQVFQKLYKLFPVGGHEHVTSLKPPPEENQFRARLLLVLDRSQCCRLAASRFAITTTFSREEIKLFSKGLGVPEDVRDPPGVCAIRVAHVSYQRGGIPTTVGQEHAEFLSQLVPVVVFLEEPDRSLSCGEPIAEAVP